MAYFKNRDRWDVIATRHIQPGSQRGWQEAGKVHSRRRPTDRDLMRLYNSHVVSHTRPPTSKSAKYKHIYHVRGRWQVNFKYQGAQHYVGTYDDEDTAARQHDLYVIAQELPDCVLIGVDLDGDESEAVA